MVGPEHPTTATPRVLITERGVGGILPPQDIPAFLGRAGQLGTPVPASVFRLHLLTPHSGGVGEGPVGRGTGSPSGPWAGGSLRQGHLCFQGQAPQVSPCLRARAAQPWNSVLGQAAPWVSALGLFTSATQVREAAGPAQDPGPGREGVGGASRMQGTEMEAAWEASEVRGQEERSPGQAQQARGGRFRGLGRGGDPCGDRPKATGAS